MKIGLLITCLADAMFPDVGRATVEVLERLGHTVAFPADQSCCGQMHVNTGYQEAALPLVQRYADVFAGYDAVVAPSGSCVGSVRHQHGLVARRFGSAGLQEQVAHVAGKTYELSELLVDVLGVTDVGAYFPHRVTYHPTCHSLRMLRVGDKPVRLLQAVDGLQLVELPDADQCCGFGGTFAVKNADTSTAMMTDKMRHVLDTGAQFCSAGRQLLPHAHRRRPVPDPLRGRDRAPRPDPRGDARPAVRGGPGEPDRATRGALEGRA